MSSDKILDLSFWIVVRLFLAKMRFIGHLKVFTSAGAQVSTALRFADKLADFKKFWLVFI